MTQIRFLRIRWLILLTGLVALYPAWSDGNHPGKMPPSPVSFRAHFTESRTLPGFTQPLVSSGQVAFSRTAGISWEVTAPYHYLLKMTSSGAEEQMPDGTIRRLNTRQDPWLGIVQHIFIGTLTGDLSSLEHYFTIRTTWIKGKRLVVLTPKAGPLNKAIQSIHVTQGRLPVPQYLHIDETSGGLIVIRFFDIHLTPVTP